MANRTKWKIIFHLNGKFEHFRDAVFTYFHEQKPIIYLLAYTTDFYLHIKLKHKMYLKQLTVKSLINAHALTNAHPHIWTLKMTIL